MTEYERSLYYTDDGIRKQLPLKEKMPYLLFAGTAFLDALLLFGIIIYILGKCYLCYLIFFVWFPKEFKRMRLSAYAANSANSHVPEAWKPVYEKNMKTVKICAALIAPLAILLATMIVITAYFLP